MDAWEMDAWENEQGIRQSPYDAGLLARQLALYLSERRPAQAARIFTLFETSLEEKRMALSRQGGGKTLIISSEPAKYADHPESKWVFAYTSDEAFMNFDALQFMLYVKQPEIVEVYIEDLCLFKNPEVLQLVIEIAVASHKRIRFGNRVSRYGELQEKFNGFVNKNPYCELDYPTEINIMTATGPCNLKCRMCPQSKNARRTFQTTDFGLFKEIIAALPRQKSLRVNLTPLNEPLMVKNFVDYIQYTTRELPNAMVTLNTNGVLLHGETAQGLIRSGLHLLIISLNMHTSEDYLWFTGKDHYETVAKNIRTLAQKKCDTGSPTPKVVVQMIDIPRNRKYKQAFIETWRPYADHYYFRGLSDWGGSVDVNREVLEGDHIDFLRNEYPCIALWKNLVIDYNGDILACCAAPTFSSPGALKLGNISNESILDVWNGERLSELRMKQLCGLQPECSKCSGFKETGEDLSLILLERIMNHYGKNAC